MSLEYAILGFLREEPMTGYDLKTVCFDGSAAHFWTADQSQIYRTLDRLESKKLVRVRRLRQTSRPDRIVYSITGHGVEELDAWLSRVEPPPPLRDPFLIRLRFAASLPDEALANVLHARRETLQERLEGLRERVAHASLSTSPEADDRSALLERLTFDASIARVRSEIDWIDDTLELLDARHEQESSLTPGAQGRLFAPRSGMLEGSTT